MGRYFNLYVNSLFLELCGISQSYAKYVRRGLLIRSLQQTFLIYFVIITITMILVVCKKKKKTFTECTLC